MGNDPQTPDSTSKERLFDAYWSVLADKGWDAVILHSWKDLPEQIDSDVDYAVAGVSPRKLLEFLRDFCREHGWRLAQVIEHEPDAYFCTCVRRGGDFDILALDVTWDYRRLGHFLIPSAQLQTASRSAPGKSFRIPSPGAEATYILAKAAAKGKDFSAIKHRLLELEKEDPDDFAHKLTANFPELPLAGNSGCQPLEVIEAWFGQAPSFRAVRNGHRYGVREIKLYLRRMLQPTGIWLAFHGQHHDQAFREALIRPLIPLFRRVHSCNHVSITRLPGILSKVIRTSMVVEHKTRTRKARNQWQITVTPAQGSSPSDETCRILDLLEARVNRRISKLHS